MPIIIAQFQINPPHLDPSSFCGESYILVLSVSDWTDLGCHVYRCLEAAAVKFEDTQQSSQK